jgi:hypothetical protein
MVAFFILLAALSVTSALRYPQPRANSRYNSLLRLNLEDDDRSPDDTSLGSDSSVSKRMMAFPLSMFEAPSYLDGSLAGDLGFDPLGFANEKNLFTLREIELKNSRIAMLAAFGWPSAELSHLIIAKRIGAESLLGDGGRAPSVLNGGLNNSYALFALGLFFAVGGVLELELLRRKDLARRADEVEAFDNFLDMFDDEDIDIPGNYGWDPLSLDRKLTDGDAGKREFIRGVEIFNGRAAMLATVGYIVQEYLTKVPVVKETPEFFYGVLTGPQ